MHVRPHTCSDRNGVQHQGAIDVDRRADQVEFVRRKTEGHRAFQAPRWPRRQRRAAAADGGLMVSHQSRERGFKLRLVVLLNIGGVVFCRNFVRSAFVWGPPPGINTRSTGRAAPKAPKDSVRLNNGGASAYGRRPALPFGLPANFFAPLPSNLPPGLSKALRSRKPGLPWAGFPSRRGASSDLASGRFASIGLP